MVLIQIDFSDFYSFDTRVYKYFGLKDLQIVVVLQANFTLFGEKFVSINILSNLHWETILQTSSRETNMIYDRTTFVWLNTAQSHTFFPHSESKIRISSNSKVHKCSYQHQRWENPFLWKMKIIGMGRNNLALNIT